MDAEPQQRERKTLNNLRANGFTLHPACGKYYLVKYIDQVAEKIFKRVSEEEGTRVTGEGMWEEFLDGDGDFEKVKGDLDEIGKNRR